MAQFTPPDIDVRRVHAAIAVGHPVTLRYQDRDCPVTFVQMEGTAPVIQCTVLEPRTGTTYTLGLLFDGDVWAQLLAQLPG